MKISKHFVMQEFLPEAEYLTIMKYENEELRLKAFYSLIDRRIVKLAEFYREYFKVPVIINNWHTGGTYTLRGWRPKNCPIGAINSMHKQGKAFDCDIKGLNVQEVRKIIMLNEELFYKAGLRRIESDVTWLHSDIKRVANYTNKIYKFKP